MAEPSVFVLGAQKCGTTTVADVLAAQPEVFVPSIKETYFFCDESLWAKGIEWYRREFYGTSMTKSTRLSCDATPFYLASREAIDRLADHAAGHSRFVAVLRDPVARAYSAYWHQRRLGNEPLSFEEALEVEPDRIAAARAEQGRWWRHAYVEVGRYADQLRHAFARLGRDRVLVLAQQDLRNMETLQRRLRDHLALLPKSAPPAEPMRSNSAAMPRSRMLQRLVTGKNPAKATVQALLPREFRTQLGRKILARNLRVAAYPAMEPGTRAELEALFASELEALADLGIDAPVTAHAAR